MPKRFTSVPSLVPGLLASRITVVKSTHSRRPPRAAEILRHYVEHPGTCHTFEGVAEWQLLEDLVQQRVTEIDQALRWLVAHGFLERISRTPATQDLYRLNPDKRSAAERLLSRVGSRKIRRHRGGMKR